MSRGSQDRGEFLALAARVRALEAAVAANQPLDATLTALAAFNTNGLLTQTAANTFAGRTITGSSPILVTNGDGVAANPTISLGFTLTAEQASTSGTSIDFTSIPSWVRRIVVQFVGVSTNGTNPLLIQIGDSGGIETSGYLGSGAVMANAAATAASNSTAGFIIQATNAAAVLHGAITLTLEDSSDNTWVCAGSLARSDIAAVNVTAGSKATSATLDRVRITTVGATDTFDAGVISIQYSQ